jgi:hypothetical protein
MCKNGKCTGKTNLIDAIIILAVLLIVGGVIAVKSGKFMTSSNTIKEISPIEFDVITRTYDLTAQKELFKEGDKSFLTIRNVPYTALEIVNVVKNSPRVMMPNPQNPQNPVLVKDIAYPNRFSYTLTLKDNAIITEDGPVVGGNKIKIGLPVDIEGSNYRMTAIVSDVRVVKKH